MGRTGKRGSGLMIGTHQMTPSGSFEGGSECCSFPRLNTVGEEAAQQDCLRLSRRGRKKGGLWNPPPGHWAGNTSASH